MSEFLLMASPDGDVMIPATFYGEARLVFGPPPEEEPPQACGPDMVPGVFHAEIVFTFDLLTRLGFLPVPPAHPDYPLYLDALAEHRRNPPDLEPVVVPNFNDPDSIWMSFEKTVLIPPESYWRYGLVLPPRPGSVVAFGPPPAPEPEPVRETQPVPPVRRLERGLGGGLMVPLPPPRPRQAKTPEQGEAQRRVLQEITDWGFRDLLQRRAARPAKAASAGPSDALLGCMCDTSNAVSPGELHDAALMPFLGASDRRAPTLVARDQGSAAPLPPGDFDAFLDFIGDPDGHPLPVADRASGAPVAPARPERSSPRTEAPSSTDDTRQSAVTPAAVRDDVAALQAGVDHASVAGDRHDAIVLAALDPHGGIDGADSSTSGSQSRPDRPATSLPAVGDTPSSPTRETAASGSADATDENPTGGWESYLSSKIKQFQTEADDKLLLLEDLIDAIELAKQELHDRVGGKKYRNLDHSGRYKLYRSGSGTEFAVPLTFNMKSVIDEGKKMSLLSPIHKKIRLFDDFFHAGTFDFQRDATRMELYRKFVPISNYAIGVACYYAGYTESDMVTIAGKGAHYGRTPTRARERDEKL